MKTLMELIYNPRENICRKKKKKVITSFSLYQSIAKPQISLIFWRCETIFFEQKMMETIFLEERQNFTNHQWWWKISMFITPRTQTSICTKPHAHIRMFTTPHKLEPLQQRTLMQHVHNAAHTTHYLYTSTHIESKFWMPHTIRMFITSH